MPTHSGNHQPLRVGYLSHVLGNALSASGVPLFYPWSRKRFRVSLLPVNSLKETLVVALVFFLILFVGAGPEIWQHTVYSLPPPIQHHIARSMQDS